ncbi:GntR family transcriptional regulator [Streptomyces antimicrobicus]|uniref:GntR family transcriptional regulator n=1 Tax=Streptomyces antimicrobicus TaxID=2883108 RepID=A0ABS8BB80_9ACTN|nr:GntR family transcriptional regulator [Streptomyces antimicrobicus]MCB5181888.1 GntR family transcriptional regulator [Streptomyces antimicrobicus]
MAGLGYRELAEELRRRIDAGEFASSGKLPPIDELMEQYSSARQTVRSAVAVLSDEGIVVPVRKAGTLIRNRSKIKIPLSRYGQVLTPGGARGPWEAATATQGLDGDMRLVAVERVEAPADLATLLRLREGESLVYRLRHALIRPDDVVQLQHAWYPAAVAEAAGLDSDGKITGGVYGALVAAGHQPTVADETVTARMPTDKEAADLRIGGKVWVLALQRLTLDASGRPLEVLRAVAPADRLSLVYDGLPIRETS